MVEEDCKVEWSGSGQQQRSRLGAAGGLSGKWDWMKQHDAKEASDMILQHAQQERSQRRESSVRGD